MPLSTGAGGGVDVRQLAACDEQRFDWRWKRAIDDDGGTHQTAGFNPLPASTLARRGAPTRWRRSDRETTPPNTMNAAPNHIQCTNGLK